MSIFGHPLHPITVHFPIAWYVLGVMLTAAYLWRGRADVERFGYWCFILSWFGTLLASLTGLMDQGQLAPDDPRWATLNWHTTAALSLFVINGLLVYLRLRWPEALHSHRPLYLGLMAAGLVILTATGWTGGELVYRLSVGVQP